MLAHHPPAPTAQVYRARDPKKKARGRTIQRALLSTSAPCVGSATGASVRVERTRRTRWRSALREKGALALSVYSRTVSREVSGDGEGGLLPRRLNGAYLGAWVREEGGVETAAAAAGVVREVGAWVREAGAPCGPVVAVMETAAVALRALARTGSGVVEARAPPRETCRQEGASAPGRRRPQTLKRRERLCSSGTPPSPPPPTRARTRREIRGCTCG